MISEGELRRQRKNKTDEEAPLPGHSSSRTTTSMETKVDPVVNNSDNDEDEDILWQQDPLEQEVFVHPILNWHSRHMPRKLDSYYIQAANLGR